MFALFCPSVFPKCYIPLFPEFYSVAPWPGGARGGPWPPLWLRPVGKLSMLSEIVKVVDRGGGRFKMLSSGKFFGLSEKIFGLPEKYCPWPLLKHWSHGATGSITNSS